MIVVDTNILVYRWFAGGRGQAIDALVRLDPVWVAPPLWRSEFRNVLARAMRQAGLAVEEAEKAISKAADSLLGGERFVSSHIVLGFVARSSCTAYDCEFAGLAAMLQTTLFTEDAALLKAFPGLCRSLDEVASGRL